MDDAVHDNSTSLLSGKAGLEAILPAFVGLEMTLAGLIALFGIAGNILTILVLRVPNLRKTSTAFYFAALASVDILVLLIGPTVKAVSAAVFESNRHIRDIGTVACKLVLYLNYSSSQISAWVLVAVTIDRAIWVLLPFQARQLCTVKRAAIVVAAICFLICCINSQVMLHANMIQRENLSICHLHDPIIRHTYVTYIDPGLVTIGPFLIMLAANLLIVRKLRQVRARRETSLNKQHRSGSGRNLTRMLLCTNFFYLLSSLPYLLLMLLLKEKRVEIMSRPVLLNVVYLIQILCYSMFNLNYAIHFLLYCLAGPAFKAEAFRILGIRQSAAAAATAATSQRGRSSADGGKSAAAGGCRELASQSCHQGELQELQPEEDKENLMAEAPSRQPEEMELLPVSVNQSGGAV